MRVTGGQRAGRQISRTCFMWYCSRCLLQLPSQPSACSIRSNHAWTAESASSTRTSAVRFSIRVVRNILI
jgi:hypothetical protein